ncbi:endospore germination permease [Paenibacillus sp. HN-1]|uniref:GerAB/ArcD/ProY family transporter n=1 Tax=Paenibacillus TaxID=44249 RepID=UPI001CAA2F5F|nr:MULTISPECIES: endospore germination permease [Paenibacillus]MBY9077936.1 endospore germination permease [Paenibacillus sp. CGMCC 1.18879]MBY9084638.1 endospore germination permease [Paenibacillus sinensis]
MYKKESISASQMSMLFFTYLTGSAITNIPGPLTGFAKTGAWISLLISWSLGTLLLLGLLYLNRQHPGQSFIDYSQKMIGGLFTVLLAIPFISLVLHMSAGIVLDIGLFFKSSMLRETPMYVIHASVFLIVSLTARSGIETMARMFTVLIAITVLSVVVTLLLSLYYFRPEFLLPIAPEGIKPILHGAYFTAGFPYGEIFLFSMLTPYVRKEDRARFEHGMLYAILANGICFILVTVCAIMVLGPVCGTVKYTLFQIARLIDIQDIIERIESLIGFALVVGSFMKATIALLVLALTITRLLKLPDYRILIFPLALVNFLFSIVIYKGETRWSEVVGNVWPLWNAVANIFPLIVLTLFTLFTAKKRSH